MNIESFVKSVRSQLNDESISSIYFEVYLDTQGMVVNESLNRISFNLNVNGVI